MTLFNAFFTLEHFAHQALFDGIEYVWEALSNIRPYLKNYALGRIEGNISEEAFLIDRHLISIGEGSVVEPGAYIKGPCIIGRNCTVRHGAYIRGDFITGDNCVIGHDTEVKHSIFLNHAVAGHFAYVGDSILGNNVNLGAGTKCANLRFDDEPVVIQDEKGKVKTSLRKLGVIMGDGSQTGCNSVTNPGTLMERFVMCYPCMNFGGFIPSKTVIKPAGVSFKKLKLK